MKLRAVLNRKGGSLVDRPCDDVAEEIRTIFEAEGHEIEIAIAGGKDILPALDDAAASDADALLVGGGDGTVGAGADRALRSGKALAVLPLGTLNLLARDLGVPLEMPDMARALARGEIRTIDVGEVNGIPFLNHSAVGLYPLMIRDRERERRRTGIGKWPAMAEAAARALKDLPLLDLTLDMGDGPRPLLTPSIVIANNPHDLSNLPALARPRLDGGRLAAYVALHDTRAELLRAVGLLAIGQLARDENLETHLLESFVIDSPRKRLRVANDGELHYLEPPLRYRIRPHALKIVAPNPATP